MSEWLHDALMRDLAGHLAATGDRLVWCDVQLGPSGSDRPDVYTLQKSFMHPRPMSYECKISVSDFRADVCAGKWQKYLGYSCGVTFAFPDGLLKKEDVPSTCGVMVRGEKGWRTVRRAVLEKTAVDELVLMKLLIEGLRREWGWQSQEATLRQRMSADYRYQMSMREQLGADVALAVGDLIRARQIVEVETGRARKIIEDAKKKAEMLIEERVPELRGLREELCAAAGVDAGVGDWELRAAVCAAREAMNRDGRVKQLEGVLAQVRRKVDEVMGEAVT